MSRSVYQQLTHTIVKLITF